MIGIDGAAEPRILFGDVNYRWITPCDWSKDGKRILAWLKKEDGSEVAVISVMDGSIRVLKEFVKGRFNNMVFSPRGDDIVYDDPNGDIFILSLQNGKETALVKHPANDSVLGWGPDGEHLLFTSDRSGMPDIWAVKVDGGKAMGVAMLVKSGMGADPPRGLGTTKEGLFYYSHFPRQSDIFVTEVDPETGDVVSPPREAINHFVGSNATPDYSPDGKYMAYVSKRAPFNTRTLACIGNVLVICSLESGEEREFRPASLNKFSFPRWSPDGRSVMVVNWEDDGDRMGLYVIDAGTGKAKLTVMTQEPRRIHHHAWSADGKSVYLVRSIPAGDRTDKDNVRMQIVAREIASGEETELLSGTWRDVYSMSRSPDGRWLAVVGLGKSRDLRVMPVTGGEPSIVNTFEHRNHEASHLVWSADGKYIFLTKHRPTRGRKWDIWRISVEGGKPQNLGLEMDIFWGLSAHPDGRHIAFSNRAANYKLPAVWVMENFLPKIEPKGTVVRQVWAGPGVDIVGAPSPDGRYLSYVDWDTGDLAVYEITTGKERRLTNKGTWEESNEFALFSRWSPDGRQIVYDWYNKNDFIDLCIVGLDGSKPRILYSNKEVIWAQTYDWSPDGKQILVCLNKIDGPSQIVLVSVADGTVRVLKTLNKYPQSMNFSPNGRYIVYDFLEKENSREHDISVLLTDGNREIPLIEHPANDCVLGWAPDGRHILFASDRTGTRCVWLIATADGRPQGAPELVKQDIGQKCIPMGFTKDGSFYYGTGREGTSDVYTAKLDPETGKVLLPPKKAIQRFEGHNRAPDYSPDGKHLAYVSTRGRHKFLCIHSVETGQERAFPSKLRRIELPRWSPDGRSILIAGAGYRDNSWGIYQVDIQTGAFTLILPRSEGVRFRAHEWSRDGESFFLAQTSRKDKLSQIILREIESGTEKELYRSSDLDRLRLSCSPDGKWLAFTNMEKQRSLTIIPAIKGEPRELYSWKQEKAGFAVLRWTPDGKYILFVMRESQPQPDEFSLWRIPVEGGDPQKIGLGMGIANISVHPDGQHIAFNTLALAPAEVWVIENFMPELNDSE